MVFISSPHSFLYILLFNKEIIYIEYYQNETGIYVIAAHRLVLCTQLFDRIIDLVIRSGLKVNFLYVGSEHYNFTKLNNKYKDYGFPDFKVDVKRTTSQKEILEIVELSRTKNRHL